MKKILKSLALIFSRGPLASLFGKLYLFIDYIECHVIEAFWIFKGYRKPKKSEIEYFKNNVTFIYKSFERQKMAKRLYKSIQSFYPGIRVIIADDSKEPLDIEGANENGSNLTIIHLPFNSGLSYGIQQALDRVETPFVIRMDDDQKLSRRTAFGKELKFLKKHPEVDLAAVLQYTTPFLVPLHEVIREFKADDMSKAPKKLLIPHGTELDEEHVVYGKVPNVFIARTEKYKQIGYDKNVRMIDHRFFFWRAAGNIVSVVNKNGLVFHSHNIFDQNYQVFRSDTKGDNAYIFSLIKSDAHSLTQASSENRMNKLFLSALKASLEGKIVDWEENLSSDEWKELFQMAEIHHVLPMIYEAVYDCRSLAMAGPGFGPVYRNQTMQAVMKQAVKSAEFQSLFENLRDNDIRPCVVKGIICRDLYPNPDARSSNDEDVFVDESKYALAHKVLTDYGLDIFSSKVDANKDYEVPYWSMGNPLYIEMHKHMFPPESEAYGNLNRFFDGIHDRREQIHKGECGLIEIEINGTKFLTMNHTDHLLYLILHSFKHFLHSGFGIRQVCDINLYATAYGKDIDWDYILSCLQEVRADLFAAAMFAIGEKYLTFDQVKACYPRCWKDIDVDEIDMLNDLLASGVFGNSDMSRKHSSNITLNAVIADKRGETVDSNKMSAIIKAVCLPIDQMVGRFTYLEKFPFLLPFAWLQRVWIYKKETKHNKSENNATDSIKIGNDRIELMRKYGIIK